MFSELKVRETAKKQKLVHEEAKQVRGPLDKWVKAQPLGAKELDKAFVVTQEPFNKLL